MIRVRLRRGDGIDERSWLQPLVMKVQRALIHAGVLADEADGSFGADTERSMRRFQSDSGIAESGIVDASTWQALRPHLDAVLRDRLALIGEQLSRFDGDLDWVHVQEGHRGRPYWPGGESGVTLDPGVDAGHAAPALVERLYAKLLTPGQLQALRSVFGIKGDAANEAMFAIPEVLGIRVTKAQAEAILPFAAKSYWDPVCERFSSLRDVDALPSVQTALLSLAYNRGVNNSELNDLSDPMHARAWADVADRIGCMQQDHSLMGIRERRRREASLIRAELEFLTA